jgi:aspartokinase
MATHEKENISELIWLYVKGRPSLRDNLRQGFINHSSLARALCSELGLPKTRANAVKAALIRISKRLAAKDEGREDNVLLVLSGSSLSLQTKVAAVVSRKELQVRAISSVRSGEYVTSLVDAKDLSRVRKEWGVKLVTERLNLITIRSGEELEETPGVISFLLGTLAHDGINVVEFISCYTDTLLAVREEDTAGAYDLLSSILR